MLFNIIGRLYIRHEHSEVFSGGTKNSPTSFHLSVTYITFTETDIQFTDDCVLLTESENDLQQMLNHFHVMATAYGQEISILITKIMVVQSNISAVRMQSILTS